MTLVLGLVEERNLSPSRKTKNAIVKRSVHFTVKGFFSNFNI